MEEYIKRQHDIKHMKREKYFKQINDNITDGSLILKGMSLIVAQRYGISQDLEDISPCWKIAEHYIFNDEIECGFEEWLHSEKAPFLTPLYKIGIYFPEFKKITDDDYRIVELANKYYNLDLVIDDDWYSGYVYAFSFDFNSFTPINLDEVVELMKEISFCKKYGLETKELEGKLSEYGLPEEMIKEEM